MLEVAKEAGATVVKGKEAVYVVFSTAAARRSFEIKHAPLLDDLPVHSWQGADNAYRATELRKIKSPPAAV